MLSRTDGLTLQPSKPSRMTISARYPKIAESSSSATLRCVRDGHLSGRNDTKTSTSLSEVKSSRNTDPKMPSLDIPHLSQKAASEGMSTSKCGETRVPIAFILSLPVSLACFSPASFASPLSQAGRRGVFGGSDQAVEFGFQVGRDGFLAGAAVEVVYFKGVGCEIVEFPFGRVGGGLSAGLI